MLAEGDYFTWRMGGSEYVCKVLNVRVTDKDTDLSILYREKDEKDCQTMQVWYSDIEKHITLMSKIDGVILGRLYVREDSTTHDTDGE